jgi:SAM-dependent methyltransferase
MRNDGWTRDNVMALPYIDSGYWFAQAVLMEQTLDTVPFEPGETIVDIGSNTCWAAATFAGKGLRAIALDIADAEMQGLKTADWQFEAKGVYFDRVLGSMFDLPFADGSLDNVWACEVLHHNHRSNLAQTYREIFRVLKPGGRLIVANEPLRTVMTPKINPGHEVAQFEGHEHAYVRWSYTGLARKAGFQVDVRGPRYHAAFQDAPITLTNDMPLNQLFRAATVVASRRIRPLQKALLAGRAYVMGGTALHMVCTKPG